MNNKNMNPSQSLKSKNIIITGANSGLGYYSSLSIAMHGGTVIMAVRNIEKGRLAQNKILNLYPESKIEIAQLDLSDLNSIEDFATSYKKSHTTLEVLMNNAGVMAIPYSKTKNGFETQFGSNHFGHFALTGHLFEMLSQTIDSRVVTLTSIAAKNGYIKFDDLQSEKSYEKWAAYSQSKVANLMFAMEFDRRIRSANLKMKSIAAHPGISVTNLFASDKSRPIRLITKGVISLIAQSARAGSLPQILAATDPSVESGDFYGPKFYFRGAPSKIDIFKSAQDVDVRKKLWEVSEELTKVKFEY